MFNWVHLVMRGVIRTHNISGDRQWLHRLDICKSNYHTITTIPTYMWTFRREHFSPDFEGPFPCTVKIFRPEKKSSTIKSWPTFCDQYFWKFPIWNSCADEKHREIRMVKVNVIINDIRLLIYLTPLQINWVMVIN